MNAIVRDKDWLRIEASLHVARLRREESVYRQAAKNVRVDSGSQQLWLERAHELEGLVYVIETLLQREENGGR